MPNAPFIPAPINKPGSPFFAAEVGKLLGMPALRCSVSVSLQGAGVARVAVQVRNCTGEACSGVYRVHIFASATPGGGALDSADATTNERGQVTADLTSGAGTRYFSATVLGVYDTVEKVVT